ncbi:MAG TPA: hypothetical protein VJN96_24080 [Vicinamibacterales bacterium]|nr:hypothetical protein [Vicinamibacterales bacterium]
MKFVRPVGLVLLGALLGGVVMRSTERAHAQDQGPRLIVTDDQDRRTQPDLMGRRATTGSHLGTQRFAFIKDTQSGACWLKLEAAVQPIVALAPAPPEACK